MPNESGAAELNSYGDSEPEEALTERLRRQLAEALPDYAFGLEILGTDVIFGHFHNGAMMVQGYLFTVACAGYLLGPEGNVVVQAPINGHFPVLKKDEAANVCISVCQDLRRSKANQMLPNSKGDHK